MGFTKENKQKKILFFKITSTFKAPISGRATNLDPRLPDILPGFVSLLCFLADSGRVRFVLCWLTQESHQHSGSWTDGNGSQCHGGGPESDIRGLLLTSDQRKHLGETQEEVTGSITSPVVFDTVTSTWCMNRHHMLMQTTNFLCLRGSCETSGSNVKQQTSSWSFHVLSLFRMKWALFKWKLPVVGAVVSASSISRAFRQERAECFTRLVCLSSASQAACLAHKNAGKTPSSAAPPPDTSRLRGEFSYFIKMSGCYIVGLAHCERRSILHW